MKKILIISSILLILTLAFLLVYNFVFKTIAVSEEAVEDIAQQIPTPTPIATEKKISQITNVETVAAALFDGQIRYYDAKSGAFMQISTRGTSKEELFNPRLDIARVQWSADGRNAIMTAKDGTGVYAFTQGMTIPLTRSVDYAHWSQEPDKIIYKAYDEDTQERSIHFANPSGEEDLKLTTIPFRRVSFAQIPNSFVVAYWQESDSFTPSELRSVGTLNTADPRLMYEGLFGADYLFSPDGQRILVSYTTTSGGSTMNLGVMNKSGGEFTGLNIPTLASKAVWSRDGKTVYYAQPLNVPTDAVMPNDYNQGVFTTQDTFWKVDITTGEKSRLISLEDLPEEIDASNLFLDSDESILFFINRANGNLYRLNI